MKRTGIYVQAAIMAAFAKRYNTADLAKEVCDIVAKNGDELQVYETRPTSFIFKFKRSCMVTESDLMGYIAKAIKALICKVEADFCDDMNDRYEFDYDSDLITKSFVDDMFNITKGPKNFFVEMEY